MRKPRESSHVIPGSPLDEKQGPKTLIRSGGSIALDPMDIIIDILGPVSERINLLAPGRRDYPLTIKLYWKN